MTGRRARDPPGWPDADGGCQGWGAPSSASPRGLGPGDARPPPWRVQSLRAELGELPPPRFVKRSPKCLRIAPLRPAGSAMAIKSLSSDSFKPLSCSLSHKSRRACLTRRSTGARGATVNRRRAPPRPARALPGPGPGAGRAASAHGGPAPREGRRLRGHWPGPQSPPLPGLARKLASRAGILRCQEQRRRGAWPRPPPRAPRAARRGAGSRGRGGTVGGPRLPVFPARTQEAGPLPPPGPPTSAGGRCPPRPGPPLLSQRASGPVLTLCPRVTASQERESSSCETHAPARGSSIPIRVV